MWSDDASMNSESQTKTQIAAEARLPFAEVPLPGAAERDGVAIRKWQGGQRNAERETGGPVTVREPDFTAGVVVVSNPFREPGRDGETLREVIVDHADQCKSIRDFVRLPRALLRLPIEGQAHCCGPRSSQTATVIERQTPKVGIAGGDRANADAAAERVPVPGIDVDRRR